MRFAIGWPDGVTSNSWRFWVTKQGNVYIACRDNFREVKVSLHASGRWRMGFTTEALDKIPNFLVAGENRAWEVWDEPPATLPNAVVAFKLLFLTAELCVRPEQRVPAEWKNVIYIEAAPRGKLTAVTLFITVGEPALSHASELSFCLASLDIGNGRRAQLVAHGEPEGNIPGMVTEGVRRAWAQAETAGVHVPEGAYACFFGQNQDGSRFLVCARVASPPGSEEAISARRPKNDEQLWSDGGAG